MYRESKNFGFGDLAIGNKGKNDFLISVNTLLDWDSIEKILKASLKRGFNAIGQPPYSELLLFKILLLQTWFNLSDTKVEEAINDRISFIKFLNLSIESDTPDHSTISRFRNSLIKDNLDKKLFLEVNRQLESKGILVKVIDDAGLGKFLPEIDVILLGCDIIMHETFITNAGAHVIAAAAKHYDIPIFVLADSRKILNKKFFPQSVLASLIGSEEKSGDSIWKNAPENIEVVFNHIEEVPNHLITKFILEKESLTPSELPDKIDKVLVANFF